MRAGKLKASIFIATIILFFSGCAHRTSTQQSEESATVQWSSAEAQTRFSRAIYKGDFFQLANYFEPQANKFFCGPATGTIILNALFLHDEAKEKPVDESAYQWPKKYLGEKFKPAFSKFTQNSFLNPQTDSVKTRDIFYGKDIPGAPKDGGLQLSQFARMLEIYGLDVKVKVTENEASLRQFKTDALNSLKDGTSFMVANFDRRQLGQIGGGHISPVAAYDAETDSFLVLDVNPVVTEWFWVRSETLFAAMHTKDATDFRGYLIVSRH